MTFLCCLKIPDKFYDLLIKWSKGKIVKTGREKDKFARIVFRKDTFSCVYINFNSFVALEHNFGVVYTFTILSDFSEFHFVCFSEFQQLRRQFTKMVIQYVDKCIAKFFNNIFVQKPIVTTVSKLELRIALSYLGNISSITKKRLNRRYGEQLQFCKLTILFQTGNRLKIYFRLKDCVPETLQSNFVSKLKYRNYTASYYGKTYRHMKVRISKRQGVSPRTGEGFKGSLSTSVIDCMLNCDHRVAWQEFSIIGREWNHYLLETKESTFIKRDRSCFYSSHLSRIIFALIVGLW